MYDVKLQKLLSVINKNKPEFGSINVEITFHQGELRKALIIKTEKVLFEEEKIIRKI
jgi:hypothetical protein